WGDLEGRDLDGHVAGLGLPLELAVLGGEGVRRAPSFGDQRDAAVIQRLGIEANFAFHRDGLLLAAAAATCQDAKRTEHAAEPKPPHHEGLLENVRIRGGLAGRRTFPRYRRVLSPPSLPHPPS